MNSVKGLFLPFALALALQCAQAAPAGQEIGLARPSRIPTTLEATVHLLLREGALAAWVDVRNPTDHIVEVKSQLLNIATDGRLPETAYAPGDRRYDIGCGRSALAFTGVAAYARTQIYAMEPGGTLRIGLDDLSGNYRFPADATGCSVRHVLEVRFKGEHEFRIESSGFTNFDLPAGALHP